MNPLPTQAAPKSKLSVVNVSHAFGGNRVLREVNLDVADGSITSLIGPNGSGKTTLFNVISGFLNPQAGRVLFEGQDITKLSVSKRSRLGLMRTFQAPQLFSDLTVVENIMMGVYKELNSNFLENLFRPRHGRRELADARKKAMEMLQMYDMEALAHHRANKLPAGQQRNIELIRSAISTPEVLLLDEPSSGLTVEEVDDFISVVLRLQDAGTTVFLVSHDMRLVGALTSVAYVLNFGEIIVSGTPSEIQRNERVREVYLGTRQSARMNDLPDGQESRP